MSQKTTLQGYQNNEDNKSTSPSIIQETDFLDGILDDLDSAIQLELNSVASSEKTKNNPQNSKQTKIASSHAEVNELSLEAMEEDINEILEEIEEEYRAATICGTGNQFNHRLLSKDEEQELFHAIAKGDMKAREVIITHNQKLVLSIAKKVSSYSNSPIADMVQNGNIGLMTAIEKFDPSLDLKFSTYAYWWINQAIKREAENSERSVYLPSHIISKSYRANRKKRIIENQKFIGVPVEMQETLTYQEKIDSTLSMDSISLDAGRSNEGSDKAGDGELNLYNFFQADDSSELWDDAINEPQKDNILETAMRKMLNEKELKIMRLRFAINEDNFEHTLDEISDHVGVTRERVRQLINSSCKKIKSYLDEHNICYDDLV